MMPPRDFPPGRSFLGAALSRGRRRRNQLQLVAVGAISCNWLPSARSVATGCRDAQLATDRAGHAALATDRGAQRHCLLCTVTPPSGHHHSAGAAITR
jgi:hypothetical protein